MFAAGTSRPIRCQLFTSSSFRRCVAAFHAISAPAFRLLLNVAVFGTHQRDVEFFAAPMVSIIKACFRCQNVLQKSALPRFLNPKLTWLALGRDHTDGSRKAKQRIALCRSRSLRNPFWGSPQQNFCLRQLAFAPLSTFIRIAAAPRFVVDCIKNRASHPAYLLGLLALIKCSICSYTADTVYVDQRVYIICQTIFQGALACCSLLSPGRCCGGFALVLYAATLIDFQTGRAPFVHALQGEYGLAVSILAEGAMK